MKPIAAVGGDCRDFGYEADDHWAKLPPGSSWTEVAAVAVDSKDRVYVFNRGALPVAVFDRDGSFITAWGQGKFGRPHGICIGPDDSVYCTDDLRHAIHQFTGDGQRVRILGRRGVASDTGATSVDYRTIQRAGPPFHYPTNLAVAPSGDIYVSDGYGNARVHRFSSGRLQLSWGEPGGEPGQFRLPHGIAIDSQGTVYVADRENSRIQLFTAIGEYLGEWRDVARPCQICIDAAGYVYVAELGFHAGTWPGTPAPRSDAPGGRVSIFDQRGRLLARWGGGCNPCAAGDFFAPHGICVDSRGDIYVAEVVWSAGAKNGLVSPDCHTLQKFSRKRAA